VFLAPVVRLGADVLPDVAVGEPGLAPFVALTVVAARGRLFERRLGPLARFSKSTISFNRLLTPIVSALRATCTPRVVIAKMA